jgi:hypothetical protein
MNLACPSLIILSLTTLLYIYTHTQSFVLHVACVGMGIVVLGVCWVKIGRRRRFGYFGGRGRGGGGEFQTTDPRGCTPQCAPTFTAFGAQVLGFYLRMEDMSLTRSESEWIILSIGLSYTPSRRAWG